MKNLYARISVGVVATLAAAQAFAVGIVDYSTAATTAGAELTSAIASALPLFGTIVAVGVGYKMVKKFWK